jgi:hypothetical protein
LCDQDDVAYAFQLAWDLDTDHDGRITAAEFQAFWTRRGRPVPKDNNVAAIMVSTFGAVNVDLADFVAAILRFVMEADDSITAYPLSAVHGT